MFKIVHIIDEAMFQLDAYKALAEQVPLLEKRGVDLLAYMHKIICFGELYAVVSVDGDILKGLIGFYANNFNTHTAYISLLVVDSSVRGRGYGQQLLDLSIDICCQRGMRALSLNVVRNNKIAILFYQRNGFVISGPGRDIAHVLMSRGLEK